MQHEVEEAEARVQREVEEAEARVQHEVEEAKARACQAGTVNPDPDADPCCGRPLDGGGVGSLARSRSRSRFRGKAASPTPELQEQQQHEYDCESTVVTAAGATAGMEEKQDMLASVLGEEVMLALPGAADVTRGDGSSSWCGGGGGGERDRAPAVPEDAAAILGVQQQQQRQPTLSTGVVAQVGSPAVACSDAATLQPGLEAALVDLDPAMAVDADPVTARDTGLDSVKRTPQVRGAHLGGSAPMSSPQVAAQQPSPPSILQAGPLGGAAAAGAVRVAGQQDPDPDPTALGSKVILPCGAGACLANEGGQTQLLPPQQQQLEPHAAAAISAAAKPVNMGAANHGTSSVPQLLMTSCAEQELAPTAMTACAPKADASTQPPPATVILLPPAASPPAASAAVLPTAATPPATAIGVNKRGMEEVCRVACQSGDIGSMRDRHLPTPSSKRPRLSDAQLPNRPTPPLPSYALIPPPTEQAMTAGVCEGDWPGARVGGRGGGCHVF